MHSSSSSLLGNELTFSAITSYSIFCLRSSWACSREALSSSIWSFSRLCSSAGHTVGSGTEDMRRSCSPIRSRSRWYSSTWRASASQTIKLFLRESWKDASSRRKASRASSTDEGVKGERGTTGVYATEA